MAIETMKGGESWIAFAEEKSYNGALAAVPEYVWPRALNESLKLARESKSPQYLTGSRETDISTTFGGGAKGDVNFNPDIDTFPWFLKWALGNLVTAQDGTDPVYIHTSRIKTGELRSFKVFKNVGGLSVNPLLIKNNGCKINILEMEIVKQDWMKCRTEIFGRDEADGVDIGSTVSYPDTFKLPVYDICMAKIAPSGTVDFSAISPAEDIETVTVRLNNNLSLDDIVMNRTGLPRSVPEGAAEVTIDLSTRDSTKNEYLKFKDNTEFALALEFDTGVAIPGSTSSPVKTYSMEMVFPRCHYNDYGLNISGKEQLVGKPVVAALKDQTAGFTMQAKAVSTIAGYPDAV